MVGGVLQRSFSPNVPLLPLRSPVLRCLPLLALHLLHESIHLLLMFLLPFLSSSSPLLFPLLLPTLLVFFLICLFLVLLFHLFFLFSINTSTLVNLVLDKVTSY